jgi:hypothetical protein
MGLGKNSQKVLQKFLQKFLQNAFKNYFKSNFTVKSWNNLNILFIFSLLNCCLVFRQNGGTVFEMKESKNDFTLN